MKLLDLFCGAGGAAVGYSRAGFDDITGVDIVNQPRYPYKFIQADALEYLREHGKEYDVIHASPVCKGYSQLSGLWQDREYPDDISVLRELLIATGKPYVIENVVGAPLKDYVMLCGSMFGLRVYRHRLFECNPPITFAPRSCNHWGKASGNKAVKNEKRTTPNLTDFDILTITGHDFILEDAKIAMGIDWMQQSEISQAVPPAYTEWIGKQMIQVRIPSAHC
jgi:DNA (cytosine-5)-methyltransferase 1